MKLYLLPFFIILFCGSTHIAAQSVDEINNTCNEKLMNGDLFGVVVLMNEAIEKRPEEPSFYNNRGIANFHLENYGAALSDLDKAEALGVKNAFLPYLKGNIFFATKRFEQAIEAYTKFLSTEEGKNADADYIAWFEIANSYINTSPPQFDKSIKFSEKVLISEPCEAAAHWNIYVAHKNSSRMTPALTALKKAVSCMPTNDYYISTLGDEYALAGDFAAAKEMYEKAIAQNDNMGQYYSNLAYCYEVAGDTQKACKLYKEAQLRKFTARDCHISKLCGAGDCEN